MNEVQYTLTRDDFWHLQLHAFSRQRRRLILFTIAVFVSFVYLFVLLGYFSSRSFSLSILTVVFSLLFALFATLFIFGLLFLRMWLATSRSHEVLGKTGVTVLSISEQGVQVR